jgi:hypothetical protein
MPIARTISILILVGSLVGCSSSSGLPTQRAYSVANLEQPQPVSYYCGDLVGVAPAVLPNLVEPGVGVTPRRSQWLLGLHGGAVGPNGYVRLSAGFVDLVGIASDPAAPTTEYTVQLHTGMGPPTAVIVVQNQLPQLYPESVNLTAPAPVVVRVVGNSGRVMRRSPTDQCSQTPLPIPFQGTQVVAYPTDVTHSFVGANSVVYMHYPSGGIRTN